MNVVRFERPEFLVSRWDYRPGEHVSVIEPTQGGKTTLLFQLLEHVGPQVNPPVLLVAKPRDRTVSEGIERLGYREIPVWPPPKRWLHGDPAGYALWPRHVKGDTARTRAHQAAMFQRCLEDCFWRGDTIIVADEVYYLSAVLGLDVELTNWWTQGAGMGAGLWSATQKPSGTQQGTIPGFMYSAAVHSFLGRDPDERNRRRFAEIGGVNPKMVAEKTQTLNRFEKLYINRNGPTLCVVGA